MDTRYSRARWRGRRFIQEFPVPSQNLGRGIIGKISNGNDHRLSLRDPNQQYPVISLTVVGEEEAKESLEAELRNIVETGQGSVIHMTLKYFISSADDEFYVDKVMEYLLQSPSFIENFTMSFKLITFMKTHGESVKQKMFMKLDSTFKMVEKLMKEGGCRTEIEREKLRNLSDLLGQMFFKLRVVMNLSERYDVLSKPVCHCLTYLITVRGRLELKLFSKLVILNYATLTEKIVRDLKKQVLRGLQAGSKDGMEVAWLMFALEVLSSRSWRETVDVQFYKEVLQHEWKEVPWTRVHILADIPMDIVNSHMDKFNITAKHYCIHQYVTE